MGTRARHVSVEQSNFAPAKCSDERNYKSMRRKHCLDVLLPDFEALATTFIRVFAHMAMTRAPCLQSPPSSSLSADHRSCGNEVSSKNRIYKMTARYSTRYKTESMHK